VFDITHALRYQPMLGMVLINYLKVLKNIKVQAIYYGAFESLGQISDVLKMELIDRNAAVLNLNSFSNLQDWTNASDIFVNFGNAKRIIELSESNEQIKLAEEMQNVLRLFSTVRGKEILDGNRFDELKAKITNYKAKIINVPKLRPFIPIIDFMQNSMSEFSRNNLLNGFKSIKFCIDNELIQQAFTLMQEMIISYILAKESENPTKKISRIVLSACFSTKKEDYTTRLSIYEQEDIKKKNEEDRLKDKFYKSQYLSDFGSIYSSLTKYRNDLNHAGMKGDAEDSEAFYKNAIAKYNELVEIVNKIECKPILHKIL